ncbi:MAG: transaldolase [Pseudomonadales bacterium]|nr:transaldolase [Pseudomonadales bacterium]
MSQSTDKLHALGQRLWLDNITRDLLDQGGLTRYIDECSVSGLTSNPTIFDNAIAGSEAYDQEIRTAGAGVSDEALFMTLALQDLRRAADLFHPQFLASQRLDGWVSMEISPLLARDTRGTLQAAREVCEQAARENLFVKIPGTAESIPAIEEATFAGIPVNVTLLFSPGQYRAAAEAYMRGLERRAAEGLSLDVASVASVFVSRWDAAVHERVPEALRNRLGIAICTQCHAAGFEFLRSPRWRALAAAGARPQRLLWASTGTKDPQASDTLYVESLLAPSTINTVPEKTLLAFADHGRVDRQMPVDSLEADALVDEFRRLGIDMEALAQQLQDDGANAFVKSWRQLLLRIAEKRAVLS